MSMYDLVVGNGSQSARGAVLLALLGLEDVGRFRDAWLEKDPDYKTVVAVYTRNGGGNRDCWNDDYSACKGTCPGCIATEVLPAHPLYLRDADDDFDCTYATFYFKLPDQLPEEWAWVGDHEAQDPVNMSDVWAAAIDRIGKP